jgi:adenine-specific DNA-methyltransferase
MSTVSMSTVSMSMVRDGEGQTLAADDERRAEVVEAALRDVVVITDFGAPIHPGLRHLGSVARGGDKPSHVVIKGENHHVLEALRFTHAGKVDCIYIDPPYNTGARDWKYDNDYVDDNDGYRHSKWLAFMERRLLLAKELLNPDDSVLIITIDEKEYLRLGLLLEQIFSGCKIQMVSAVVSAKGTMRAREFSRVNEFLYFVFVGEAAVLPQAHNMLDRSSKKSAGAEAEWIQLRRREPTSTRASRPNQFFPIYLRSSDGALHSIGDSLEPGTAREGVSPPEGTVAIWPINAKGTEMVWGLTPETLRARHAAGYFRVRNWSPSKRTAALQYLPGGVVEGIEEGRIAVAGRDADGAVQAHYGSDAQTIPPKSVWHLAAHNAESHGTNMVTALIDRRFPFPKSLYAVEDAIRFFVKDKPDAVVLDFFGGSGTTTHAVARLNRQDGGRRQSILVTNNEVSADEAKAMRERGLHPGDPEWEALGIFEHVTRPRVTAAITGVTPDGEPIKGDYKFTDEFPMAEGFEENVEFWELTYLDPDDVELDLAFDAIAPLLWLRAGGQGPILTEPRDAAGNREPFAWTDRYGVLFAADRWRPFVAALPPTATTAFVVTDSAATFSGVASELPDSLDVVRLYESYFTTFSFNPGAR